MTDSHFSGSSKGTLLPLPSASGTLLLQPFGWDEVAAVSKGLLLLLPFASKEAAGATGATGLGAATE